MPTTTICRDAHINIIQNRYSVLGDKTFKAFSYGTDQKHCLMEDTIMVGNLLEILNCYKTFDDDVTYAYKFVLIRSGSASVTITITIGAQVFSVTSTGTDAAIINAFKDSINDTTEAPINYLAEGDSTTLYIYTYSTLASFTDTTTVTVTGGSGSDSVSATSLVGETGEILDFWNCITHDQVCSIIQYAYKVLPCTCNKSS